MAQDVAPTAITPAADPPQSSLPSIAELTSQRESLARNTDPDEKIRVTIDEQLQKTIENLQTAEHAGMAFHFGSADRGDMAGRACPAGPKHGSERNTTRTAHRRDSNAV